MRGIRKKKWMELVQYASFFPIGMKRLLFLWWYTSQSMRILCYDSIKEKSLIIYPVFSFPFFMSLLDYILLFYDLCFLSCVKHVCMGSVLFAILTILSFLL